jgi:5-methylcytosine-specific restriction endonuclease McrA
VWELKRCSDCELVYPIEEFAWNGAAKRWRRSRCRECDAAHGKRRYEGNKEHCPADAKRWREANPDKVRAALRRRRAREGGADGSHTDAEFTALVKVCGMICPPCGEEMTEPNGKSMVTDLTRDHIVPLSRGGTDWIANIQPLCFGCNSSRDQLQGLG